MAKIGTLTADLQLESAAFIRDMGRAQKAVASNTAQMRKHLRTLDRSTRNIERQFMAFRRAITGVGAAIAVFGLGSLIRDVVQTSAEFQRLQASLKTVTGGTAAAQAAFAQIKGFAAETPFDLAQVTTAFIKLKALGLDPSMEALRSYGNTASAMGKQLNDFIEAVADASTGEFERLKEFGIRAKSEGDKVTFVFQGMATTVAKTAEEIEGFLRKVGETQFAGAMEEQARTLGGALSNAQDAFSVFQNEVGEGGLASAVADIARRLAEAANGSHSFARELGANLGAILRAVANAAAFAGRNIREITTALAILAGLRAAGMFVAMASSVVTFSKALIGAARAGALVDTIMSKSILGAVAKTVIALGIGAASWQAFGAEAEAAIAKVQEQVQLVAPALPTEMGVDGSGAAEQVRAQTEAFTEQQNAAMAATAAVQDHAVKMKEAAEFGSDAWVGSLQGTIGRIQGFTGALSQESDKWFRINQAAGIANALIATYQGAAEALKLGPIIGPILAAATVATGLAYVAQIASQQPGGSAGGGSAAFTTGVGAGAAGSVGAGLATAGTTQAFNVTLIGKQFSDDQVRDLFDTINQGLDDGHKIRVVNR